MIGLVSKSLLELSIFRKKYEHTLKKRKEIFGGAGNVFFNKSWKIQIPEHLRHPNEGVGRHASYIKISTEHKN